MSFTSSHNTFDPRVVAQLIEDIRNGKSSEVRQELFIRELDQWNMTGRFDQSGLTYSEKLAVFSNEQ